ncbi:hypothetical protein GCM10009827_089910 [Dactylosporangium maewongense]|uniref:histidine kinase n=1 Tax=Dactylosporangium maewongense TaxID=634393 RepID=A0ABN2CBY4_9ACTN
MRHERRVCQGGRVWTSAATWLGIALVCACAIAAVLLTALLRTRKRLAAALGERGWLLEREREAAARAAVGAERARIARELHDIVSHTVSVMVVQASAAREVLDTMPDEAATALRAVQDAGRGALTELRHLLGLLAPDADGQDGAMSQASTHDQHSAASQASTHDQHGATSQASTHDQHGATSQNSTTSQSSTTSQKGAAGQNNAKSQNSAASQGSAKSQNGVMDQYGTRGHDLEPQPSLSRLSALVDRVAFAGLPVEVRISGEPRPLPAGVDLTAYRIVQEGLTNALKYGDGGKAEVTVRYADRSLRVEVLNTGPSVLKAGPAEKPAKTTGRGLTGLRARVAVYGGDLDARRRLGGGYRVRARIPLDPP